MKEEAVYRSRFNDGILMLQQSGLISKIMNDVRWDMIRNSKGGLLSVSSGKMIKMNAAEEKGLTLADTEGMFLLLGIGFLVAGGALVSEWVGGCTNKCIRLVRVNRAKKKEEHRVEEKDRIEQELRETENLAKLTLKSASSIIGLNFFIGKETIDEKSLRVNSSNSNPNSRSTSCSVDGLNSGNF